MPIEALVALVAMGVVIFSSQIREAYARASASSSSDALKTFKTYTVKFLTSVWFWVPVLIIWLFGFGGFTKLVTDPWGFSGDRVAAVKETLTSSNTQELVSIQNGAIHYEYMLDFSQPTLARAKLRVSSFNACEQGLRLYEAGKTDEAATLGVFEDGYAAPDGTVVLTSALICEHGPDSRDTVIWRGDEERAAYELFWQQKQAVSAMNPCDSIPWQTVTVYSSTDVYPLPIPAADQRYDVWSEHTALKFKPSANAPWQPYLPQETVYQMGLQKTTPGTNPVIAKWRFLPLSAKCYPG